MEKEELTMPLSQQKYDKDARRLIADDGAVVGLLLQYSNENWGVFDAAEKPLTGRGFVDWKDAFAWARRNEDQFSK